MFSPLILSLKVVAYVILVLAIAFNALGIYLLYQTTKIRTDYNSQVWIIANLSLAELIIAVVAIHEESLELAGFHTQGTVLQKLWAFKCGIYINWYLIIYLMCLDRFIACNFPLKHRLLTSKSSTQVIVVFPWITGMGNGLILLVLDTFPIHQFYDKYVWVSLDTLAITFFVVVYSSVFIQAFKSRRMRALSAIIRKSSAFRRSTTRQHKQFAKIIGLILLSFILFETAPTIAYLIAFFIHGTGSDLTAQIIQVMYDFALLSDPLIYIFLQNRIKLILRRKLKCCQQLQNQVTAADRTMQPTVRMHRGTVSTNRHTESKPYVVSSSL